MNTSIKSFFALCVAIGFSLLLVAVGSAQESSPSAADLTSLRAWKDAQPIERLGPNPAGAEGVGEASSALEPAALTGYPIEDWTITAGEAFLDNNWEIVTARSNAQGLQRLTFDGAADVRPAQNRDGSQIVFTSNRTGNTDLFRINSDGSGLEQLTNNPTSDNYARWFPVGDRIVFASNRDGNWEIYTMNINGGEQTRLTSDPNISDVYPAVSPDGSKIAWIKRNDRSGEIWVMNTDGSAPVQISVACDYLENLVWSVSDYLYADCDIDNDVMNEIVWLYRSDYNGIGSFFAYQDANMALGEVLVGGIFPPFNSNISDQYGITAIQLRYVVQNQNVYLDNLWSDVIVRTTFEQSTFPLAWTAIWSWVKTDWTPPITWPVNVPPTVYRVYSGQYAPSFYVEGMDSGPSGLAFYSIDYRSNGGEWTGAGRVLPGQDPAGSINIYSELGDRVDIRTVGTDYAGNVEDASSKTPYSYWYYRGHVTGQVTDRKGFPVTGATYASAELVHTTGTTAAGGGIGDDVVNQGLVGITVTHPAFQTQNYWLNLDETGATQATFAIALSPADDTLQDGGFEQKSLKDWASVPVTATRLLADAAYAGKQSLFLGQPAAYLGQVTILPSGDNHYNSVYESNLAYDEDGSLHILRRDLYQGCIQGQCSPVENIYGARSAEKVGNSTWGVVLKARSGRIVAARKENVGSSVLLRFFERSNGVWSDQVIASTSGMDYGPELQVGADGTVHVAWMESVPTPPSGIFRTTVRYREQKEGVWSATQSLYTLPEGKLVGKLVMQLDSAGMPHLFFVDDLLQEMARSVGGVWSQPTVLDNFPVHDFDALLDQAGVLHLILRKSVLFYRNRTNGVWGKEVFVAEYGNNFEVSPTLTELTNGRLALIRGDSQLYLRQSDGEWTGPHYVGAASVGRVQGALLAAGPENQLAIWTLEYTDTNDQSYVLYELSMPPGKEASERSQLQRRFVVPNTLHHPTLFFAASLQSEDTVANQDRFVVEIDDGKMITRPLAIATPGNWQDYAVSLLPWQGQEITLTLAVDAVADNIFSWVRLDAMQLASWNTPLIREIEVAPQSRGRSSVPIGVSATVVITGENFLDGATVAFGNSPAKSAKVVSSQRIEATTPSNLKAGLFEVAVTNLGGVSALQPSALAVGEQVYLPVMTR